MKLCFATILAAILLSVCSAYPNAFENNDVTPGVNMEQVEGTTRDMVGANAEDKTAGANTDQFIQHYTSDANTEQYDTEVLMNSLPQVQAIPLNTCLRYLYVLAFTSGKENGWADAQHEVEVRAGGRTKVINLSDLPGDDYRLHKGDLWKLEFVNDFKFSSCQVTLANIEDIAIEAGSSDGWNIDSIVTYVGDDHGRFMELTHDFNVLRWIDSDGLLFYKRFELRKVPQVQPFSSTACLRDLYILAFTSGIENGWADDSHKVKVRAAGQTKIITLPNLPGDDYQLHKGDLWKLNFQDDLKFTGCVSLNNIDRVYIESGSNDGWNIDSIVTYVGRAGSFVELTYDFNVFRWIDSNGAPSARRFLLSKHTN